MAVRTDLRPGDVGRVIALHGLLYANEHGFDHTFEAYVAGPLAEFVQRNSPRERIWLAEEERDLVGCIAIASASREAAQLRWFLVDPRTRGAGLGKRLLDAALDFCESAGYHSVLLWTVRALTTAAHLYRRAGFALVEERPGRCWGVDVIEERYELDLAARPAHD